MRVSNITHAWAAICNKEELPWVRLEAEAVLREACDVGMLPIKVSRQEVLDECFRLRRELAAEIPPSPVRFTDSELRFLIAALESIEVAQPARDTALSKLKHREKTMRNLRNRDKKSNAPDR